MGPGNSVQRVQTEKEDHRSLSTSMSDFAIFQLIIAKFHISRYSRNEFRDYCILKYPVNEWSYASFKGTVA
jgi:hypothetical protein